MYRLKYRSKCSIFRPYSSASAQKLVQKQAVPRSHPRSVKRQEERERTHDAVTARQPTRDAPQPIKRNEVGVQLLSRKLHAQIFKNVKFPAPSQQAIRIAQEHLAIHGLDPSQGSVLPDTAFDLPELQGNTLDEHFYSIGTHASRPWLGLAKDLVSSQLPPRPGRWEIRSGWTKYHYQPDGTWHTQPVRFPEHDGVPEDMIVFDVETMPAYSPYPVMACAATENGWYAWISPWLLGETDNTQQLIPLGDPQVHRVVVGHNVSFDRGRILEEYSLEASQTRFLDTMALHVAVQGISSHQRPAWMAYRKAKLKEQKQLEEAEEATAEEGLDGSEETPIGGLDSTRKEDLKRIRREMADSLPSLEDSDSDSADVETVAKRWEELTSANSLADVAKLHCNIVLSKETRNDFLTETPESIRENIDNYLNYCSGDVEVTHAVYAKVLPSFLKACPNPVSFAGMLAMGSSFLTVNQEWEGYLESAENKYRDLEMKVKSRLIELAEAAKILMDNEKWKDDPWLSQLDWTPKKAGKSRGVEPSMDVVEVIEESAPTEPLVGEAEDPAWYRQLQADPLSARSMNAILPLLLNLSFEGHPLTYNTSIGWHFVRDGLETRLPTAKTKLLSILGSTHALRLLKDGRLQTSDILLAKAISSSDKSEGTVQKILDLAKQTLETGDRSDPWLSQLDWKVPKKVSTKSLRKAAAPKPPPVLWPKWYWDLAKPKKEMAPGTLDITVRNRISPLLLRLSWMGWPLFHSREHGWTFRVHSATPFQTRATSLDFYDPADDALQNAKLHHGFIFYKLPHKDGDKANVGSPLAKTFMKYAADGTLTSPGDEAKDALDMNAQCSYWISARDRILNQMVVWQGGKRSMGFERANSGDKEKWGVILPQVITMGTVTRRAIEKTWLTASNAKKNRVGSELKAMVRAPPGYSIVGADVDSEELWISSCMGDAQFGVHGATAIGWMTLEGTKAAATDLHSKTASILGISRDQAKVFNYSRIYGAGMRHAVLLLLQSNAGMLPEEAQKLAENLYASTKGKNTHRQDVFGRKFWFGGTESFVFNKLEEIAQSQRPQTPALGCGVTYALSRDHLPVAFGSDYMTSRINWVVQSSGVDYLHLLIVAMQHLIDKYNIKARYLISVHDELRYLVKEEDKYRAALALQIANLWTRSLFAFKLGMDDLPQGVAFFSSVDVDHVLRKEVDMDCVTPSQPIPIPSGESLNITQVLEKTSGGSLWADGRPMTGSRKDAWWGNLEGYVEPDCLKHRAQAVGFLRAQATNDFEEVKHLAELETGARITGGVGGKGGKGSNHKRSFHPRTRQAAKQSSIVVSKEDIDWSDAIEEAMRA